MIALTTEKIAPCSTAARRISLNGYSDCNGVGGSALSPRLTRFQICLNSMEAISPPTIELTMPTGR